MGSPRRSQGFTLIELLLVAAGGSLLILAVATVLVQQLRVQHQLEGRNRLQERWTRISFLLDHEIQQAHTVAPLAGGGDGLQLTICEPAGIDSADGNFYGTTSRCLDGPGGIADTPGTDVLISYRRDPATNVLSRNGPPIDGQGRLLHGEARITSPLSSGVSEFTPTLEADGSSVRYILSLEAPNDPAGAASFSQRGSVARARIQRL